jgi:hypothetical protein
MRRVGEVQVTVLRVVAALCVVLLPVIAALRVVTALPSLCV